MQRYIFDTISCAISKKRGDSAIEPAYAYQLRRVANFQVSRKKRKRYVQESLGPWRAHFWRDMPVSYRIIEKRTNNVGT